MRGKWEISPAFLLWTTAGCSGGCHHLGKGPKNCFLSAVCVCVLQILLRPFHLVFWIFYFTYILRELISHKIIMNWYKLLLINMNDVLFSELETPRDTNALDRHDFIKFFKIQKGCILYLFLVLGEIDMVHEIICYSFGSKSDFPSGRALGCVCIPKPSFSWETRRTLPQMVNLHNHSCATSESKHILHYRQTFNFLTGKSSMNKGDTTSCFHLWSVWAYGPTHHRKGEIVCSSGNLDLMLTSKIDLQSFWVFLLLPFFFFFQKERKLFSRLNVLK